MFVEKDNLRMNFKRKLHDLDSMEKQSQSQRIVKRLLDYLSKQDGVWTLFSPLNDEPNLLEIYDQCSHLQWVFPKVLSKTEMKFYHISSRDELVMSGWGIDEPPAADERFVPADRITGCLIPGLAFDYNGHRLGRGGGYYDRYLENYKGLKLGVTFNQGLTEETLPRRSHDQKMDIVVSPKEWIEVNASEVANGI